MREKILLTIQQTLARLAVPLVVLGWLVLASVGAAAQNLTWQRALMGRVATPTSGTSEIKASAVTATGDVVVTGTFTGSVAFGDYTLTSAGNTDLFVAKWRPATSRWVWALRDGSTGADVSTAVTVQDDAVYIGGTYTSPSAYATVIAGTSLSNRNQTEPWVFVARYTDNGNTVTGRWAAAGGSTGSGASRASSVAGVAASRIGTANHVYVTGTYMAGTTFTIGGRTLMGYGTTQADAFIAEYTDPGVGLVTSGWAYTLGGTGSDAGAGLIAVGTAVYVTGSFGSTGAIIGSTFLTSAGSDDVYLAKFTDNTTSATGNWATALGGTDTDRSYGVTATGTGVYVAGLFQSTTAFRAAGQPLAGLGSQDLFVAKYVDGGATVANGWALNVGSPGVDSNAGIAADGTGGVYLSGEIQYSSTIAGTALRGGCFVAKYTDAGTGATNGWAAGFPGRSSGVSVYGGRVFSTGKSSNSLSDIVYGAGLLVPAGAGVLGQLDGATGAWQTVGYPQQGCVSNTQAMTTDGAGNVLVAGQFNGDIAFGDTSLVNNTAVMRVFLALWDPTANRWLWARQVASTNGASLRATGLARNGNSIYLATTTEASGGQVTKYTATAARLVQNWSVTVGQTKAEVRAIAVSGTNVYVTGEFSGAVTIAGVPLAPAGGGQNQDLYVAKYLDGGNTVTNGWAVRDGGTGYNDSGRGIAVSGTTVYVTGTVGNAFGQNPVVAGTATIGDRGVDLFVAKYTDNGATVTGAGAVVEGGTGEDQGCGIAVSGTTVYLTGYFSGAATLAGSSLSVRTWAATKVLFLARYTDNGTSFVGAGAHSCASSDSGNSSGPYVYSNAQGNAVAVSGGFVYVVGTYNGVIAVGATNYYSFSNTNALVVRYPVGAAPSSANVQSTEGGGYNDEFGTSVVAAPSGGIYLGGSMTPTATFGSHTFYNPNGYPSEFIAQIDVPAPPPVTLTGLGSAAELPGQAVTLTGTGFTSASTVRFGGVAAASVTYTSPTSLTAVVPVGAAAGSCTVAVTTGGASSPSSPAFEVLQVYRTTAASGCLVTASTSILGSGGAGVWRYLRLPGAGGAVVAAVEDTGNLGTVTAGISTLGTGTTAAVRADDRPYLDRNFYFTATNQTFPGQTVRVRLFGLGSELARLQGAAANATPGRLQAAQYSGANENCTMADNDPAGERRLLAAPATVTAGADWFTAEVSVPDHFSEFYLMGPNTPLPVELTTFTATLQAQTTVHLVWATASEKNSAYFDVERSADGTRFERLGTVFAAGNSTALRAYELRDTRLPAGASLYYRLRQVDLNGTVTYSLVRSVELSSRPVSRLVAVPNPTSTMATLTGATPGLPVYVFDALGRAVMTTRTTAAGTVDLVLPRGLPNGVYIVRTGTQSLRLAVE